MRSAIWIRKQQLPRCWNTKIWWAKFSALFFDGKIQIEFFNCRLNCQVIYFLFKKHYINKNHFKIFCSVLSTVFEFVLQQFTFHFIPLSIFCYYFGSQFYHHRFQRNVISSWLYIGPVSVFFWQKRMQKVFTVVIQPGHFNDKTLFILLIFMYIITGLNQICIVQWQMEFL